MKESRVRGREGRREGYVRAGKAKEGGKCIRRATSIGVKYLSLYTGGSVGREGGREGRRSEVV